MCGLSVIEETDKRIPRLTRGCRTMRHKINICHFIYRTIPGTAIIYVVYSPTNALFIKLRKI